MKTLTSLCLCHLTGTVKRPSCLPLKYDMLNIRKTWIFPPFQENSEQLEEMSCSAMSREPQK